VSHVSTPSPTATWAVVSLEMTRIAGGCPGVPACCVNIPVGVIATGSPGWWETAALRSAGLVGVACATSTVTGSSRPGGGPSGRGSATRSSWWVARLVVGLNVSRLRRSPRCCGGLAPTRVPPLVRPSRGRGLAAGRSQIDLGFRRGGAWSGGGGVAVWAEVRARAVGLVGVGRPVREVAGLVGVHPATVRRWVRQAVGRWADLADAVDTVNEHADPDPGAG
jgi:hypothetical protein